MRPKYVDHFVDIDDAELFNKLLKRANHAGWKRKVRDREFQTLRTHDERLVRSLI